MRWRRPLGRGVTAATASPLTKMLVDPEFRKKLAHIKDLKSTCNISIAPTVLAAAALGVALYIGSQKEENYSRNSGIAVGIGVGFYA